MAPHDDLAVLHPGITLLEEEKQTGTLMAELEHEFALPRLKRRPRLDPNNPIYSGSVRGCSSIWQATIRDREGNLKTVFPPHANLRTSAGNDWQKLAMAGIGVTGVAQRAATGSSATTLTDTGAAFSTTAVVNGATGGLAGLIVAVGPNASGTGSTVFGVIVSNTATVLTVDRWVAAGTLFSAGTTPNATGQYQVLPCAAPALYLALSSTVQSGAAGDTTLAGELTANGFTRAAPTTITHTGASSSYSLANTFTASGTATINSEGVFTASSTTSAGIIVFENSEPNAPSLSSGDTLAQTVSVSYRLRRSYHIDGSEVPRLALHFGERLRGTSGRARNYRRSSPADLF